MKNKSIDHGDQHGLNQSNHSNHIQNDRHSDKKKSYESIQDKPKIEDLRISTEMNKSALANQEDHAKSGIHDISTTNYHQPEINTKSKSPLKTSEIMNKSLEKSRHEEAENLGNFEELEEKEVEQEDTYRAEPLIEKSNQEDMEPQEDEKQIEDEYNDRLDMSNREIEEI